MHTYIDGGWKVIIHIAFLALLVGESQILPATLYPTASHFHYSNTTLECTYFIPDSKYFHYAQCQ